MASARSSDSDYMSVRELWVTTVYDRCGMAALMPMCLIHSFACTLALLASSSVLKVSIMLSTTDVVMPHRG
jgi:hypothetical protein